MGVEGEAEPSSLSAFLLILHKSSSQPPLPHAMRIPVNAIHLGSARSRHRILCPHHYNVHRTSKQGRHESALVSLSSQGGARSMPVPAPAVYPCGPLCPSRAGQVRLACLRLIKNRISVCRQTPQLITNIGRWPACSHLWVFFEPIVFRLNVRITKDISAMMTAPFTPVSNTYGCRFGNREARIFRQPHAQNAA
ncbi:uncharacterized protein LAESUDRAFT_578264 [Laetiporus sulphureus 93-53]|uniref:Uncharacterized protein n=1 Tax=Laetiporus sulphureus 93-53 TaxID=1314785 RepID=A0A165B0B1_9APHY|nr:uncharacterized protein LAESUDRAFT_578264 [Laetiporus sulphureus 93-53]KZS99988.1 hypothetical protein LAESUDRAFT_578264 [Laetiporus sulphureus 93-53]